MKNKLKLAQNTKKAIFLYFFNSLILLIRSVAIWFATASPLLAAINSSENITSITSWLSSNPSSVVIPTREKPNLIFSCLTQQKKKVEVIDFGETVQYSYGRVPHFDLIFETPKRQVKASHLTDLQKKIVARILGFPRNKLLYAVYSEESNDKLTGNSKESHFVLIYKNNKNDNIFNKKPTSRIKCISSIQSMLLY